MILYTNYIDKNNNISMEIAPSIQLESIITTVKTTISGKYLSKKFYDFEEACKYFKNIEKQLKNK